MEQKSTNLAALSTGRKKVTFECGCIINGSLRIDDISLDCPRTWDMIGEGLTKGVFQLEKQLGKKWCKRLKPRTIEELSDVISLIRPGCLEAEYREDPDNGKTLTIVDAYARAKDGSLKPEYIHESLEPILSKTYGVPVYQEQIMDICKDFAGFTLKAADDVRRAIGKKIPTLMAKVEKDFIEGAKKQNNDEKIAKEIFSWIDKFSGYSFNKAHGVSYAFNAYQTAWAKVHAPVEFFKSMLTYSDSKIDEFEEIKELVYEAKLFGIKVLPPSILNPAEDFSFDGDSLRFGIIHVKGIGASALPSIKQLKGINSEAELFASIFGGKVKIKTDVVEALIKSGSIDNIVSDRIRTLARYRFLRALTDREVEFLLSSNLIDRPMNDWVTILLDSKIPNKNRKVKIEELRNAISKELGVSNRKRLALAYEKYCLGLTVTGSEVDIYSSDKITTTCRDFLKMPNKTRATLGVLIEDVRTIKDKNGNWMCFLKLSDSTYFLDGAVVFASTYPKCAWIIEPGKVVLVSGRKDGVSFLVDKIEHI